MQTNSEPATPSTSNSSTVAVPVRLLDLIDMYARVVASGEKDELNETTIREMFLNEVLEQLGWDPRNRRGVPPRDRDVILEDKLSIMGHAKAPDYALVAGGRRRFFVEAKKPSVAIGSSAAASYQIRRYCWSAGLPLGVLTNFEEFAVYDCRSMPHVEGAAADDRILYFRYEQLADYWPEMLSLFGKSQVSNGSIDAYALETKAPKQSKPIDYAFLEEIRQWRIALAKDIAKKNTDLDIVDLNRVVQQLIDRLIFLRIAEARGLEPPHALRDTLKPGKDHYARLLDLFMRADDRYNSGLFHFTTKDEVAGPPDHMGIKLKVSDPPLERVISRMYYPQPYEFSVMPADILGRIYEQFLGERIELDKKGHVVVALKPDIRKAGGVYYTPGPIVDYIVTQTIGALIKGKTPKDIETIRVVDPACGSGSFLITAYQYLIDWHRDYYADKVRLAKANLETGTDGTLRVKTAIRRQILLNNIFGIDIDPQAVEVTKLSLLLKVIEGQNQMELSVGRILPDLGKNIACGNSLIGTDFSIPPGATREQLLEFNPFDWETMWPTIIQSGGFDAVIGNPPYLNIDKVWGRDDARTAYIKSHYSDVYSDKTDILFYFFRRGAEYSKSEVSFIVSRSFLEADKARKLRAWLGSKLRVREILDFQHALVFPKVRINTAIVRATKSLAVKNTIFRRWIDHSLPVGYDERVLEDSSYTTEVTVPYTDLNSNSWNFGSEAVRNLIKRIDDAGERLGDILHIGQGMQTAANTVFELDLSPETFEELHAAGYAYSRAKNSNLRQYGFRGDPVTVAYPNRATSFHQLPQLIKDQLRAYEAKLKGRAAYQRGNCNWWGYSWPLHMEYIDRARIICPYMAVDNRFAIDASCKYIGWSDTTVLYDDGQEEDLRYIAAFLNSDVMLFRFRFLGKLRRGGYWEYFENTLSELRIPRAAPGEPSHDELVDLVDKREEAWAELATTYVEDDRNVVIAVIETIDRRINTSVAELVGLTDADLTLIKQSLHRDVADPEQ